MASLGYVAPVSQQSKEGFHAIRRTTEGLLYYTKVDKDKNTTVDLSVGVSAVQLPVSGGYVDADETIISGSVEYFTGDGVDTTFDLTVPVLNIDRIKVWVDSIALTPNEDYTYSSPTITFTVKPKNGAIIAVGQLKKQYFNNTTDKYQQYIFEDGDATYYVDSDGYLVKRENVSYGLTALASDDYSTFESTSTVATTSWQSYV